MATSGTINGTAVKEWYLKIEWERESYSIKDNTSTIIADLYVYNRWYSYNNNANQAYYIIDGTKTFATYNFPNNKEWHLLGSKTIIIKHEDDGTKTYGLTGQWHSGLNTTYTPADLYVSGNITLDTIPRQANITNATDFTDEGNPTITYENPAGNAVTNLLACISFTGAKDDIPYREISKTGTSYTFNLTDEERKTLRKAFTTNELNVIFYIRTIIGENVLYSTLQKKAILVNANPEFNNFTFKDVDEKTTALTTSNQNIIKGYSTVEVTIPVANKAIAKKEATMEFYRFVCGDVSNDLTYSDTKDVVGGIYGVPNGTFTVYATDNRNNSTPVTKLANQVINYNPLVKGNIDTFRDNGVSENVKLQLDGTIDVVNFGKKTNSIISAKLRYRIAKTGEWSTDQEIEIEVSNGRFSYDGFITGDLENKGFNISNSYDVEVVIEDELSKVTFTDTFGSGVPNIAYHKNGISVMGKYDVNEGGPFQVQGKNPFRKNLVYAYTNGQIITPVTAWTDAKLNLNIANVIGNKLSWDSANHRIVLEEDASCLKFYTGYNWYNVELAGDRTVRIYKNGNTYKGMGYVSHGENYYGQVNSIYVGSGEFKKGDYFEMYINCGRDGTDRTFEVGTFMLIEVIE